MSSLLPTPSYLPHSLPLGEIRFFEKNPDPKAQTPYIVDEAFRVPASSCGSAVTANIPGDFKGQLTVAFFSSS